MKRKMTEEERIRLQGVCYRSKKGISTKEDDLFAQKMYRKYPDEYGTVAKRGALLACREVMCGFPNALLDEEEKALDKAEEEISKMDP